MSDDLEAAALEHLTAIVMLYEQFAANRPIMLFDIQAQRLYAQPYAEFSRELSARSQHMLMEQYEEASRTNHIVVFVRDNDARRLVSFLLDREQT